MSRNEEYRELLEQIEEVPLELEYTVQRALARVRRKRRTARFIGIPVGTLLGCLTGFVLMVNLFPTFAYACGRVHGLRELAKAVAWSPSLSAAVENQYVQPIEQRQEENGFVITVQYVIADQKRLNIYYTLEHDKAFDARVSVWYDFGEAEKDTLGSSSMHGADDKAIRSISVDFKEQVPSAMDLTLTVYVTEADNQRVVYAEMPFRLELDPYFTAQGEILPVGKEFTLDDQRFTLAEAEIYPTHLRIRIEAHEENTVVMDGAELYLENEHGERFAPTRNGIISEQDEAGKEITFIVDSTFFSRSEQLTLYITEVRWKDWEAGRVRVDLSEGTAENLPEGIQFLGVQKGEDDRKGEGDWYMWFTSRAADADEGFRSIFSSCYWDTQGNESVSMGRMFYNGLYDPLTGEQTMKNTGRITEQVVLRDYMDTVVWLEPAYQRLEESIKIVIKE